ncbi:hypothetical protein CRT60_01065 [Azospirillum palustre]|uniref:Uncharacterized protein n=1 Tax=Azospirillum palustre TaxID=2044885 RepID=A0A2B8BPA5_9PROT|nr:hypothetical protein [Azospirillum palustre]PGH59252.1 hypothetical protein CRT60_01065 [Azospirillum palustre]
MATNTARTGSNSRSAQRPLVAARKPRPKTIVIDSIEEVEAAAVERRLAAKVAAANRSIGLVEITDLNDDDTYKMLFGGS